jgi:hypothetical protein
MQLIRQAAPLTVLLLVLAANPAQAGICTLLVLTPGTLAMSADGNRLGSEELGGLPATMTVGSVGASTLTFGAPTVTQSPAGHNPGGDLAEVSYSSVGVLAAVNHGYTSTQTQFPIPNIIGVVAVTLHNRVTNASGFGPGTYQTRTVVTCS